MTGFGHLALAFALNTAVVALSVMMHYECLYRLSLWIPRLKIRARFRIVVGVFGALLAHICEVWLFGIVYLLMIMPGHFGDLKGNFDGTLLDCVYFSFTSFTTLGFGDIEPHGAARYLAGLESLTGLVLITWTASFLYLEMQRYWVQPPGD